MLYMKTSVNKEIETTERIKRSEERSLNCHGSLDGRKFMIIGFVYKDKERAIRQRRRPQSSYYYVPVLFSGALFLYSTTCTAY